MTLTRRQAARLGCERLTLVAAVVYGLVVAVSAAAADELVQARGRLTNIQDELAQAVQKEDAAYRERDAFLAAHFELLQSQTRQVAPSARDTPALVNPRWQELDRKVRDLELRRTDLLDRLTPAHPALIAIEDELAQTTASRDAEPQLLVPEAPPAVEMAPADVAVLPAAKEAIARYAELEAKCRAAALEVDRLDAAQRETSLQIERLELVDARRHSSEVPSSSQASASIIWCAVIVALVPFAFFAARLCTRRRKPTSPQAIARTLGVHLLGVVYTRPSSIAG
jgi:hypothetical protein